jgi:long-chain acyl-CoA synthetase
MADDTLARMFWSRVRRSPDRPAHIVRLRGGWQTLAWAQVGDIVRELALGLLALGRQRGERVALLSASRAEWAHADMAIFSIGCVTVPIYPTYPADLIAYVVNDSQARTLIVEDAAQLAKALEARPKMETLEHIVVMTGHDATRPLQGVLAWDRLRRLGTERRAELAATLDERLSSTGPADVASIVYTSGTTGPPKGVVQTHGNHIAALRSASQATPMEDQWVHLLFLPMAHAFGRLESFLGPWRGLTTAFAENLDKLSDNLREIRPHFIFSVPRVFEKVYARVLAGVDSGSPLKKRLFQWALDVGRRVGGLKQAGKPVPRLLAVQHGLAHRLVFSKLHAALGGRLRWAVSGGAPLAPDIARFFHATGILILEGYGLTETCPVLTFNRPERFKFGSVGQALPGVELRIGPDGEILARGPNIATLGYYRQPDATREVFEPDGWFHTGDIGRFDDAGFLYITDRKKDLIVTAGGMNIAPQNIENLLKADPFISQALVYGDCRPYPVALVSLNADELGRFARERGLAGETGALIKHPLVVERVERTVVEKNGQLQSYAQIKRFAIVPGDFSQDSGELTPTLKLKRKVVLDKYRELLEELYR